MKPAESGSPGTGPRCKQAAQEVRGWAPPRIYLHDQRLRLGPPLAVSHQLLLPLPAGTQSHGEAQAAARRPPGCIPPRAPCTAAPALLTTLHGRSKPVRGDPGARRWGAAGRGSRRRLRAGGTAGSPEAAGAWRSDFPAPASPCCSEGLKFTVCAKILQEINARKEKKKKKAEKKKKSPSPSKRSSSSSSSAASSARRHRILGRAAGAQGAAWGERGAGDLEPEASPGGPAPPAPSGPRPRARARARPAPPAPRPPPPSDSVTHLQLPKRVPVPGARRPSRCPPRAPKPPPLTCFGRR